MLAIRWAFAEKHVVFRWHAHQEMLLDRLSTAEVLAAGARADLLEDYADRPEGHTLLLLGHTAEGKPVHIVANVSAFERDWSEPVVIVTVYRPESPNWVDERTRG
jgi:hypothetical protein